VQKSRILLFWFRMYSKLFSPVENGTADVRNATR
jgi:hypothetical protein